jgi:hypothetical protein
MEYELTALLGAIVMADGDVVVSGVVATVTAIATVAPFASLITMGTEPPATPLIVSFAPETVAVTTATLLLTAW